MRFHEKKGMIAYSGIMRIDDDLSDLSIVDEDDLDKDE